MEGLSLESVWCMKDGRSSHSLSEGWVSPLTEVRGSCCYASESGSWSREKEIKGACPPTSVPYWSVKTEVKVLPRKLTKREWLGRKGRRLTEKMVSVVKMMVSKMRGVLFFFFFFGVIPLFSLLPSSWKEAGLWWINRVLSGKREGINSFPLVPSEPLDGRKLIMGYFRASLELVRINCQDDLLQPQYPSRWFQATPDFFELAVWKKSWFFGRNSKFEI